jgi:hypothetical protein
MIFLFALEGLYSMIDMYIIFNIKRAGNPENGPYYFKGMIDDISIWDRALTRKEIRTKIFQVLDGNEKGLLGYW